MRMIEEYQRSADPLLGGMGTFDHAGLGFSVSDGHVFPQRWGCVVLQRRRLYPDVGEWTYCGMADFDAQTVHNWPGFSHEPGQAYQYRAATAFGNAQASEFTEPIRVDFDEEGDLIDPPMPMFPVSLRVTPIADGKFHLAWDYDPYGHGGWPKEFHVFGGADDESIDYDERLVDDLTGLDAVPVTGAQRRFEFTTEAFSHATLRAFAVRSVSPGGVAEKNTRVSDEAMARVDVAAEIESVSQAVQGRQR
jgi:hypothetical protein